MTQLECRLDESTNLSYVMQLKILHNNYNFKKKFSAFFLLLLLKDSLLLVDLMSNVACCVLNGSLFKKPPFNLLCPSDSGLYYIQQIVSRRGDENLVIQVEQFNRLVTYFILHLQKEWSKALSSNRHFWVRKEFKVLILFLA